MEHNQLVELSDKAFAGLPTDPTTGMDLVRKVSLRTDVVLHGALLGTTDWAGQIGVCELPCAELFEV